MYRSVPPIGFPTSAAELGKSEAKRARPRRASPFKLGIERPEAWCSRCRQIESTADL